MYVAAASAFFCDLGHRIAAVTSEPRSDQFVLQQLSVSVQRGNAACVLGTVSATKKLDDLFNLKFSFAYHFFI